MEVLDDPLLQIVLKRLQELSTAILSYYLLRQFIYPRNWSCRKIIVVEELCTLCTDLEIIQNILLPMVAQAQVVANLGLTDEVAGAVVAMKVKATAMESAGKQYVKGLSMRSLIYQRIASLGEVMECVTRDLIAKSQTLQTFQDGIPNMINRIDEVLNTEMQFWVLALAL